MGLTDAWPGAEFTSRAPNPVPLLLLSLLASLGRPEGGRGWGGSVRFLDTAPPGNLDPDESLLFVSREALCSPPLLRGLTLFSRLSSPRPLEVRRPARLLLLPNSLWKSGSSRFSSFSPSSVSLLCDSSASFLRPSSASLFRTSSQSVNQRGEKCIIKTIAPYIVQYSTIILSKYTALFKRELLIRVQQSQPASVELK